MIQIRTAAAAAATLLLALGVSAAPAAAKRKASDAKTQDKASAKSADKGEASNKPVQVGTFGDWGVYVAGGKSKTCYALAKPTERKGEGKKDAAYIFVADRPAEKVRNEVSIIMGFPMKDTAAATAKVGTSTYDLVAKGQNAWIKNPDDEAKFVDALKHNAKLIVKAPPAKGAVTVDTYALSGFKSALERVGKECK